MKFSFTDKSSYLAWRQEWRETYAQLAADIRALKRGRKQYLRTYSRSKVGTFMVKTLVSQTKALSYTLKQAAAAATKAA